MKIPLVDLQVQYQNLSQEINERVIQAMKKADFILGQELKLFEEEFAKYCDSNFALGVGSGTAALQLSLLTCKIGQGDEVITAANAYAATIEAIYLVGAKPVLIDIDPNNYNLDLNCLEKAITKKTKAIIPVHLYGQTVDMEKLKDR